MLTPVNYVDLFDRLYPEQLLTGLADENEISVEGLNARFAAIRSNQRTTAMALSAVYASQPDGTHFRDFVLPFWEVAYSKKFTLSQTDLVALRYRRGYDPAGAELGFPEARTVLYCNDCGSELLAAAIQLLVFVDGALVRPSDYHVHPSQGGFAVYVREVLVTVGTRVRVVVLRKFNERGASFPSIPPGKSATAEAPAPDGSAVASVVFRLGDLGHVHDVRYYRLFTRRSGDAYYRPVPRSAWSVRATPAYDLAVFGIVGEYASGGYEFVAVDSAEFWKYEVDAAVAPDESIWKIDLVDGTGMPAPVYEPDDVDVWAGGRLLTHGVDYWLELGDPEFPDVPPRIVFEDVHYGDVHLLAVSGAPRDDDSSIEMVRDAVPNADAVVRFDPRARRLRLVENVGLVFSSGFLELAGDGIETVADNLALHFDGLRDRDEFRYRARFVFSPETLESAMRQTEVPTVLERFARTVGAVPPDGSFSREWYSGDFRSDGPGGVGAMDLREGAHEEGTADFREGADPCAGYTPCRTDMWDLVEIHRRNHPTPPLPSGVLPRRDRRHFPATYFWGRDGGGTGAMGPWRQGGRIDLDCRPQDHGPTVNVSLDFRGEIYAEQTVVPYTSAAFVIALGSTADARGTPPSYFLNDWRRDDAGNVVLDGREQYHLIDTSSAADFRSPETMIGAAAPYPSSEFVSAIGLTADARNVGVPVALAPWRRDDEGNVVLDGREQLFGPGLATVPADLRGDAEDATIVTYPSAEFVASLGTIVDLRGLAEPPSATEPWWREPLLVVVDARGSPQFIGDFGNVDLDLREGG